MTGKILAVLALSLMALLAANGASVAAERAEVGYVEDFVGTAGSYSILRDGVPQPVALLAPVMNGDLIRVGDARGSITLRLIDREDRMVISQANQNEVIEARPPDHPFWSGVFAWASLNVDIFAKPDTEQVSASIRAGSSSALDAPILDHREVVAPGRPLAVGWVSPDVLAIRILRAGKPVVTAKGIGGLWTGPPSGLPPGDYVLELSTPRESRRQDLLVADMSGMVALPPELARPDIPGELRNIATAVWLMSQDPSYRMEALGRVAADADRSRPAGIVADALIEGRVPRKN